MKNMRRIKDGRERKEKKDTRGERVRGRSMRGVTEEALMI